MLCSEISNLALLFPSGHMLRIKLVWPALFTVCQYNLPDIFFSWLLVVMWAVMMTRRIAMVIDSLSYILPTGYLARTCHYHCYYYYHYYHYYYHHYHYIPVVNVTSDCGHIPFSGGHTNKIMYIHHSTYVSLSSICLGTSWYLTLVFRVKFEKSFTLTVQLWW